MRVPNFKKRSKGVTPTPSVPGSTVVTIEKERKLLSRIRKHKKPLLIILAVVALLLLIGIIYSITKPALHVGNYSYSKQEYNQLLAQARELGVGEKDARKALVKALASRAAADELKIKYAVTDEIMREAAEVRYQLPVDAQPTEYQKITSYSLFVEPYVNLHEAGGYKAAIVYFPFSRYITGFFDYASRGSNPVLIGDRNAVLDDWRYAKQAAESARQAYTNKTKTLEQIVEDANNDPRLFHGQTSNKSRTLLVTNTRNSESMYGTNAVLESVYASIEKAAKEQGVPQLSEELFTDDYLLDIPEIERDEMIQVSFYFTVVDEKVETQKGIAAQYNKLVKELSRE